MNKKKLVTLNPLILDAINRTLEAEPVEKFIAVKL